MFFDVKFFRRIGVTTYLVAHFPWVFFEELDKLFFPVNEIETFTHITIECINNRLDLNNCEVPDVL